MPVVAAVPPSASRRALIANPVTQTALAILLVGLAGYYNSFGGLYLFDDAGSILGNPTIRHLGLNCFLPPINGTPVTGRPLVNFTFALNYAAGGTCVWGYHVVNLLIHLLAALALFGVIRRTLLHPYIPSRLRGRALLLAGSVAALWVVHPLQTESVSYVSQRAESLMGLFYLLTFYAFIRGVTENRRGWLALSVGASLAGMASKEVMITAPMLVFLYDRTFLAGTFRAAWQNRFGYYLALAATSLLLIAEMIHVGSRGNSIGLGSKISSSSYFFTQCGAIVHYLRLVFWPYPLIIDYGIGTVSSPLAVFPQIVLLVVLASATLYALFRRPALGFLGAWFFLILAPTSSFIPVVQQTVAEHRMYLPLAVVLMLIVLGLHEIAERQLRVVIILLVIVLSFVTVQRNFDYLNGLTIWSDSVAHDPDNARARNNLGLAYAESNQPDRAIDEFQRAVEINPRMAEAHNNLGVLVASRGNDAKAIAQFQEALRDNPELAQARENLLQLQSRHPSTPSR